MTETIEPPHGWNALLRGQLEWHWDHQLRPRFEGLTDDELRWQPTPAPEFTIAWRLRHMAADVLAHRNATHFDRAPVPGHYPVAGTAEEAVAQVEDEVGTWRRGLRGLGEDGLLRPCGPTEGPFGEHPLAALALHVHRELIHHGAEVSILRDLYARRCDGDTHRKDS